MCLPSPPKDNSAAIARQREEERQGRIAEGQTAIDDTFSQFDDNFFNNQQNNFTDFFNPQVDDQFEKAREQLTFGLARRGNLQSQAASDKFGDAQQELDRVRTDIANRGLSAGQDARSRVEAQRNELINLNNSAADPSLIASRASAAATGLNAPQVFSPLGNVFAGLLNEGANQVNLQSQGFPTNSQQSFNNPIGGAGTGSVNN